MKSISIRIFEYIYDNINRCNYVAKLGFDARIFSRYFHSYNPTPSNKFKISDIYIFQNYLYTNIVWEKDTDF